MLFRQIAEPNLRQFAYLIGCPDSGEAAVVDPHRDVDRYLAIAESMELEIHAVIETHVHEDFLSGAHELAARTGANVYLSGEGDDERWGNVDCCRPRLLHDGDKVAVGQLELIAMHTPGPSPEHLAFLVQRAGGLDGVAIGVLCGDLLIGGDVGWPESVTRPAELTVTLEALYHSLWRVLDLPDYLQLWPAHRAANAGQGTVATSTIGYERRHNYTVRLASLGPDVFLATAAGETLEPSPLSARLRALNRDGPPLLDTLARPAAASVDELATLVDARDAVVLDVRDDRRAFLETHLPAAIHAPLDERFALVVGSFVAPGTPVFLIAEADEVDAAVRALVHVGLDDVTGYGAPRTLAAFAAQDGRVASIPYVDRVQTEELLGQDDLLILDVRQPAELELGRLPGAFNLPCTQLLRRIDEVPREKRLLVCCSDGTRATAAASWLARLSYRVMVLDDSPCSTEHPAAPLRLVRD